MDVSTNKESQDVEMAVDPPTNVRPSQMTSNEIEKREEAKLKAKFPQAAGGGALGGHSAFLQKKLAKGQKYFDSGDYQMARQNVAQTKQRQTLQNQMLNFGTGEAIPTPESVPMRKTSIIQPKFHPSLSPPPPQPPTSTT